MSWLRGLVCCLVVACGATDGDDQQTNAIGGSAGTSAGSVSGGKGQTGGSTSGGSSGASAGDAGEPGSEGGLNSGGEPSGTAGTPGAAGSPGDLVDCDPRKIVCKIATPQCEPMQVPSVEGTCYGPCVDIDRCACSSAAACPDELQYTCWSQTHCGPYVR